MKREPKPKREKGDALGKGFFSKAGGIATRALLGPLQESLESGAPDSRAQVRRVVDQLSEIPGGVIEHGQRRCQLMLDEQNTLAKVERPDGSRVDLMAMVFAGDTVYGVVRTSVRDGEGYKADEVSVVELPFGHYKKFDGHDNSPVRVIASMKPSELQGRQLPSGTVQDFEEITIGRGDGDDADPGVSREHLRITFTPYKLEINDGSRNRPSTNGTYMLGYPQGIAAVESKKVIGATPVEHLVNRAQDHPTTWDPSLAGLLVIPPDGPQR